jgi:hypothetical protein
VAGIFVFQIIQNAMTVGVRSVTKGGRLILNSAFPRALLPLSAVITAFMRFLPTIVVYIPIHIRLGPAGQPEHAVGDPGPGADPVMAAGLAMLGRGRAGVLPRPLQLPALHAADLALHLAGPLLRRERAARLQVAARRSTRSAGLLTAWSDALFGHPAGRRLGGAGPRWGLGIFLVAGLFFLSREREFAVRL